MRAVLALALIAAAGLAVVPMAGAAKKKGKKKGAAGAVYTQTNDTTNNKLVKYKRRANGSLYGRKQVSTGGQGSTQNVGCGMNCPILDSSGAVDVIKNGRLIFVVNAGSDSVSSFRETKKGPKLVDQESTGGDLPESVTAQGGKVYVLNVNSRNITGFKYTPQGQMTPIAGSTESLGPAGGGPLGAMAPPAARQIGFDRSGDVLIVSDLLENVYDVFVLGADDTPGVPTTHTAQFPLPFGFAFDKNNRMIGSELGPLTMDGHATGNGHASSYATSGTGTVTDVNTVDSGGVLPCWVAITPNGKYAYVVNTGGGDGPASVARYRINADGSLASLGTPTPAQDGEFALTDDAVTRDGKFLYVLAPGVKDGDTSGIYRYKIGSSGGLKFLGISGGDIAVGASGLDAR
jgi:hypothetical protein